MIITTIQQQKKKTDRFNIFLDGRFYCGLTAETIVKNRLKEGVEISKDEIDKLQLESEKQTVTEKAVKYLGSRLKTKKQLIEYLKGKGYVDAVINYALGKLEEYNFIDDKHYAKSYVNYASQKAGKRRIANDLKQKGVCEKLIKEATDSIEDEYETALMLGGKYIKNKENNEKTRTGLYRFLAYRGFSHDDIIKVMKDLLKQETDD